MNILLCFQDPRASKQMGDHGPAKVILIIIIIIKTYLVLLCQLEVSFQLFFFQIFQF